MLDHDPTPFPNMRVRRALHNTSSADSFTQVEKWIARCRECRPRDAPPTPLPKRVVDVSASPVRLLADSDHKADYTCLSHCWGSSKPACITLKATIAENQAGINCESIPKTFQDAIDFTRRLGIQYIWIDSLCILQDDLDDWKQESAKMATIYQNSYLTLCATSSSNCHGGLYSTRSPQDQAINLPFTTRDGTSYDIYCQTIGPHLPGYPARLDDEAVLSHFPLLTRAWCFQERHLSPRLLHFTDKELMWECGEFTSCECTPKENDRVRPAWLSDKQAVFLDDDTPQINFTWRNLMSISSRLNLTYAADRLPALSGLAKRVQAAKGGVESDEYLAGLWRSDLISFLLWSPQTSQRQVRRPGEYIAPTWSFTSVGGPIEFAPTGYRGCTLEIRSVSTVLSSSDITGGVVGGKLVVLGETLAATYVEAYKRRNAKDTEDYRHLLKIDGDEKLTKGEKKSFRCDCAGEGARLEIGVELLLIKVVISPTFVYVLRLVEGNSYRRVGCIENFNMWDGFQPEWVEREVTIV